MAHKNRWNPPSQFQQPTLVPLQSIELRYQSAAQRLPSSPYFLPPFHADRRAGQVKDLHDPPQRPSRWYSALNYHTLMKIIAILSIILIVHQASSWRTAGVLTNSLKKGLPLGLRNYSLTSYSPLNIIVLHGGNNGTTMLDRTFILNLTTN